MLNVPPLAVLQDAVTEVGEVVNVMVLPVARLTVTPTLVVLRLHAFATVPS